MATAKSDRQGLFCVMLAPGEYSIIVSSQGHTLTVLLLENHLLLLLFLFFLLFCFVYVCGRGYIDCLQEVGE